MEHDPAKGGPRSLNDGLPPEEFCTQCHQRVLGWARHALADSDDAEDLAQDVCVRCWSGRAGCRRIGRFGAWLRVVMGHCLVDCLRRRAVRWRNAGPPLVDDPSVAMSRDLEERVRAEVHVALAGLPPRQKDILVLRYVDGLAEDEVARRLGVRAASLPRLLRRAKDAFRKAWPAATPTPDGLPAKDIRKAN